MTTYSDAFLTGDAITAYELFSRRCADRLAVSEFAAVVERAGQLYGEALPLQTYDAEVSGTMARVTYTYSDASISQDREPWVVEDGAWRQDDC